jgi:hypothetical protein
VLDIWDTQLEEFKPWEKLKYQFGLEEVNVVNFNKFYDYVTNLWKHTLIKGPRKYKHGSWIGLFSNKFK